MDHRQHRGSIKKETSYTQLIISGNYVQEQHQFTSNPHTNRAYDIHLHITSLHTYDTYYETWMHPNITILVSKYCLDSVYRYVHINE